MLSLIIPWWGRALAMLALVAAVWGHGFVKGLAWVQDDWDKQVAKVEAERIDAVVRAARVSERVVTKYVDRVRVVRDKTAALTAAAAAVHGDPALSGCFVRLHNDATQADVLPDAACHADEKTAPVEADQGLRTVIENYGNCREVESQLNQLQEFVLETRTPDDDPSHDRQTP